jgi:hypothetical protein
MRTDHIEDNPCRDAKGHELHDDKKGQGQANERVPSGQCRPDALENK